MHSFQDQASQFGTLSTQDEWHGRGNQQDVKKIIAKATKTYKDWHEKLPFALHAYRTRVRTSTEATPYSLVYGMEAVLPIKVEIPSLQVLREVELEEAEWV